LDGDVHFSELFTAQFMRTHTDEFGSFEEFLEESPWTVESEVDFEAIPEREFDEYVAGNTVFKDWESMMSAAAREWAVRQLDS
jgi:hypothetical protein